LLASQAANVTRERTVTLCRELGLAAYDRRSGEGFLPNLVVREGRRSGQLQLRLVTTVGELNRDAFAGLADAHTSVLWTQIDSVAEVTQGGVTELLAGDDRLDEEVGAVRLRVSPHAFLQT